MEPHTKRCAAAVCRVAIGAIMIAATGAGMFGCQTSPSHRPLDRIDQELARLERAWDEARVRAEDDEQAQARLNERYVAEYLDLVHRAMEMRLMVIYEDWQDARAIRRKARGLPPPAPD